MRKYVLVVGESGSGKSYVASYLRDKKQKNAYDEHHPGLLKIREEDGSERLPRKEDWEGGLAAPASGTPSCRSTAPHPRMFSASSAQAR